MLCHVIGRTDWFGQQDLLQQFAYVLSRFSLNVILKQTASHRHFLPVTFHFLIALQFFLRICLDGVWTVPQSANAVSESAELLGTT